MDACSLLGAQGWVTDLVFSRVVEPQYAPSALLRIRRLIRAPKNTDWCCKLADFLISRPSNSPEKGIKSEKRIRPVKIGCLWR